MRNYKKTMLGTLDAWSTSHLSQRTSVLYCILSDLFIQKILKSHTLANFNEAAKLCKASDDG